MRSLELPDNRTKHANMFMSIFLTAAFVAVNPLAYSLEHVNTHNHHHHHHELDGNKARSWGQRKMLSPVEELSERTEFREKKAHCGTTSSPRTGYESESVFEQWLVENPSFNETISRNKVQVEVYWHSIQKDDGSEGATEAQIVNTINVLNAAYDSSGFQFVLNKITTTKSTYFWGATDKSAAELDMKRALRVGDCSILNVYTANSSAVFGWSTFPQDCKNFQVYDGVVIDYRSVVGGATTGYNLGDILVHEVSVLCYVQHGSPHPAFP